MEGDDDVGLDDLLDDVAEAVNVPQKRVFWSHDLMIILPSRIQHLHFQKSAQLKGKSGCVTQ